MKPRILEGAGFVNVRDLPRGPNGRPLCRWCGKECPSGNRTFCSAGDEWQADHVVPVAEGGGGCGLEGLRTLCTACHKLETAKLARRRAEARQAARGQGAP